jgi:hypothetical protein
MIRKDASVEGAFYVCPAYNEMILQGLDIGIHHVERERYFSLSSMHGVNTYEEHLANVRRGALAS